jgi:hypothetical protein
MRLTLLILVSFVIQWQTQPGVQYVVERQVGAVYQPVDTFTGNVDTIDALEGSQLYRGRAVKGIVASTPIATLYLDWAPGDLSPVDIKSANVWEGDTLCYVKTRMSSKFWHCAYTWKGGRATTIECQCEFDYFNDGKVGLNDLIRFGTGYGTIYNLSDFASFGEVYQRASRKEWREI